jgi:8-oxo-dGTP diphosphatase / 2-hydroxy-dATP diphosphatase
MESRTKLLTLVLIRENGRILLGMKKRGFGAGKWNGFGGKVEQGEEIVDAAVRELHEEAGIVAHELEFRGVNRFSFVGDPVVMEVHTFEVMRWEGEPIETDEMRPHWFAEDEMPYDAMWPDDRHWMPYFFDKREFSGEFAFSGEEIVSKNIALV